MALISCPECGKEISDKVKACPHCGYPMQEEPVSGPQQVEVTGIKINAPKKSTKMKLLLAVCAVLVVAFVVVGTMAAKNSQAKAAYLENLREARMSMLSGGAMSETICNKARSVWYNTIFEKDDSGTDKYTKTNGKFNDDFNTSLSALYNDGGTELTVTQIKDNQKTVDELMDKLKNPPSEYSDAYETAKELYDIYCDFTSMAISPSGSLNTYSESIASIDSDFMKSYEKLGRIIPEEEGK